jgi:AraC-like DNA-binding protein
MSSLSSVPCHSARFIPAFAQVLSTNERFSMESLEQLRAIDPACRISATVVNDMAVNQVSVTGDADLGLKAARAMPLGRAGPLDYAIHSAATVRESVAVADRYIRMYSDALTVRLDANDSRAVVTLAMSTPAPRPILDFTMGAWYANHIRRPLAGAGGVECWFSHPRPSNTTEYERSFEGAALRFDAPSYGFAFEREYLEAPLPCADASLHALLCEHVQTTLERFARRQTLIDQVREIVSRDLLDGAPTVFTVADELRTSARTLGRRLERQGTTFSAIVDGLRQELARQYVIRDDLGFTDIASQLGFSHVESFFRAFRRWTGRTPLKYRRAHAMPHIDRNGSVFMVATSPRSC